LTETLLAPLGALPESLALSLNPYETKLALLRLICYGLVFLLGFAAYRSRRGAFGLSGALLTIGVLEAAYGIAQLLTGRQYIFQYGQSVRERTLAAGCTGAMAAILIHGVTDFNLQIPENALIFSWIAGTAAALVRKPSQSLLAREAGPPEILD
jgi:hypothetical protein